MAQLLYNEVKWGKGDGNYPPELLKNMRPDDEVVAYIEIVEKGISGCLRSKVKNTGNKKFVAITHERVVGTVQTRKVNESIGKKNNLDKVSTFNIPLVKVTSLLTYNTTSTQKKGLFSKTSTSVEYHLVINAQGEEIDFYTGMDSTVNDEFVKSFLEISDYF